MSSAEQNYFNEMQSGAWADRNPSKCLCGGTGWVNSDLDTLHCCPLHGAGAPHPLGEGELFDFAAHLLRIRREAFVGFRAAARRAGFKGNFKKECLATMMQVFPSAQKLTPAMWVDAAEVVCVNAEAEAEEAQAAANGFSCALEARFASYAEEERRERMH
jgi:hypothetical protein